jgi:peptidoglycan/xylan/chitin deacetylase (PgdA/CDA1 family)
MTLEFMSLWHLAAVAAVLSPTIGVGAGTDDLSSLSTDPRVDPDYFEVVILASQSYGVIPFEVILSAEIAGGSDEITDVHWDFDGDGARDAHGTSVSHIIDQPVDLHIAAEIVTELHGTINETVVISGHTALMTITFDDGPVSIHYYGLPLLESRGVKATVYVVIDWILGGWYLDWTEIQELHDAGWDIGSHTMTHPTLTTLDDSTLHYELRQSQIELEMRGFAGEHFAVPRCSCNDNVIEAIMQYYQSSRTCTGSNPCFNPRVEAADRYRVLSCVSDSGKTFDYYKVQIDTVVAARGWYVLTNHSIEPMCYASRFCIRTDVLAQVIDYALAKRVKIATMEEALEHGGRSTACVPRLSEDDPTVSIQTPNQAIYPGGEGATMRYTILSPVSLDISVYDTLGRRIRRLVSEVALPGEHSLVWNGTNDNGSQVPSGTYFCGFRSGEEILGSARVLVLR